MAGKARVHELAKELGVTSKELLARLKEQGEFVKSASSTVEAPVARRLRESFPSENADAPAAPNGRAAADRAASSPAKPGAAKPGGPRPGPKPAPRPAEPAAQAPAAPAAVPPAGTAPAAAPADADPLAGSAE